MLAIHSLGWVPFPSSEPWRSCIPTRLHCCTPQQGNCGLRQSWHAMPALFDESLLALEACVVTAGLPEPLLEQLDLLSYREQLDAISTGCHSAVACRKDVPNLFSPSSLTGQPSCSASPTLDCSCLHDLHCRGLVRWKSSLVASLTYTWFQNPLCSPC